MDIGDLLLGEDFVEALRRQVSECEALIVLIGPQWLSVADDTGKRRLDDPSDFVRLEIEAALQRNIKVVPVLIDKTLMPQASDLPETIAALSRRHGLRLTHEGFRGEIPKLVNALKLALSQPRKIQPNAEGSELTKVREIIAHAAPILSVAISPTGRQALSGSEDGTVRVFDLETGDEVQKLIGHSGPVTSVHYVSGGRSAITGSQDSSIRKWNVEDSGKQISSQAFGSVRCLAPFADGETRVVGWLGPNLYVGPFNGSGARECCNYPSSTPTCLQLARDGRTCAVGYWDHSIIVWNINGDGTKLCDLKGHTGPVLALAISPDGTRVISASADATLKLWDIVAKQEIATLTGHASYVSCVAILPDGRHAVSGGSDRTIRVWPLNGSSEQKSSANSAAPITSIAVTPDGQHAVTGNARGELQLWALDLF